MAGLVLSPAELTRDQNGLRSLVSDEFSLSTLQHLCYPTWARPDTTRGIDASERDALVISCVFKKSIRSFLLIPIYS